VHDNIRDYPENEFVLFGDTSFGAKLKKSLENPSRLFFIVSNRCYFLSTIGLSVRFANSQAVTKAN
jgi:hypothetical protein